MNPASQSGHCFDDCGSGRKNTLWKWEANARERKFEDVVKSAEPAAVLVSEY